MRASRLVSVLLLLQTHGRMTARQLADAVEVSIRTIYRDVEALSQSGVPIYGHAGRDGGYQLVDGYQSHLTGLTASEAETLFLGGLPSVAAELGMGRDAKAAHLKILASLSPESSARTGRVRERVFLDLPAWYSVPSDQRHLHRVADAVWHQHVIRMRYDRWEQPHTVTRRVKPLGLVLKAGQWYVVACEGSRAKTYRVARIRDLTTLDEHFERPDGFDLGCYWAGYLKDFDARRHRTHASLRLSPAGYAALPYLLTADVAAAVTHSAQEPDADGWRQARLPIESIDQATLDLLRLGNEVEVLGPPALRAQMITTVRVLAQWYLVESGTTTLHP